jgi:ADP-ribosylglycohydrolase
MSFTTDSPTYYDKVLGGWVGKCAGGILGAPIEGYKTFNAIELSDELFASNFPNDDLDLQVLWLDMVDRKGPWVREADFTAHWRDHVAFPWNEYGIATRNIRLGLDIPDTGRHNNDYWSESMGSPIRSEIWGMLFPGDPARAARYARMDSELDHTGFSVHAEQFFSACAALAFVRDDLQAIMQEALGVIPLESDCATLVQRVGEWYTAYGFAVTAAKIKSYYGDADFTSAPMNVGFTILSIHHAGTDFDRIIESLHLGHDSDCVVATAAALLGIVRGHAAIPDLWKERVGNELLISPEVSGIRTPATLTELAEWTCAVGRKIEGGWPAPDWPLAVRAEWREPTLKLVVENLGDEAVRLDWRAASDHFPTKGGRTEIGPSTTRSIPIHDSVSASSAPTRIAGPPPPAPAPRRPYIIELTVAGQTRTYPKGIPDYGRWLLLGPFIRADPALEGMDTDYPDHGMSSLPSVRYMNHDRVNGPEDDFLDHAIIEDLIEGNDREGRPFGVTEVRPPTMTVDLGRYFRGRGERTLYLTTVVETESASRHWLCLGSTAYLTAWVNGEEVLRHRKVRRRWPATAYAEIGLRRGRNVLTVRLDTLTDDYRIRIGLKDHRGRHHHQSQWNTDLAFSLPTP